MIAVSGALSAALAAGNEFTVCDLYTLTLGDGTTKYRWTSNQQAVVYGGFTYVPSGIGGAPVVERDKIRLTSQLEVDTLGVTLLCGEGAALGALPLVQAAFGKVLDGATFQVDYAFLIGASWEVVPARFSGYVAEVEPSSTAVKLTIKSGLEDLNRPLPRRTYQVQCNHSLFDPSCGLSASAFKQALTVLGGATTTSIQINSASASGYFTGGYLTLATGESANVLSDFGTPTHTLTLAVPLLAVPGLIGVDVYPGCDKTVTTCSAKFANPARFGGYPYIPRKMAISPKVVGAVGGAQSPKELDARNIRVP